MMDGDIFNTGLSIFGGHLLPPRDNTYDLGTSSLEWKDLYIDGIAYIDELKADTISEETSATGVTIDGVLLKDNDIDCDNIVVSSLEGYDVTPGSDTDADLITVNVTGTPKIHWDEAEDKFQFSKGIKVGGDAEFDDQTWFDSNVYLIGGYIYNRYAIRSDDDKGTLFGTGADVSELYETADANANALILALPAGGGTDVSVFAIGDATILNLDLGLFDGVTQPTVAVIEKDAKYTSSSTGTHDGTDLDELTETDKFGSSVAGDIVRIISGTNVTPGWYRIKVATDAHNIDLDRNFASAGAASDVVYIAYHNFGVYASDGPSLPAKYADFTVADFDFDGVIRVGYQLTDHEIQVMEPNGAMYVIQLGAI